MRDGLRKVQGTSDEAQGQGGSLSGQRQGLELRMVQAGRHDNNGTAPQNPSLMHQQNCLLQINFTIFTPKIPLCTPLKSSLSSLRCLCCSNRMSGHLSLQ